MSTKKIEGWLDDRPGIDQDMGWATVLSYEPAPSPSVRVVTLVIHSGERDTVHTGAEVREMLKEVESFITIRMEDGSSSEHWSIATECVRSVAARHGFTL